MENIRLREQSETGLLYIKAGEKPLKSEVFGIADILSFLISGEIHHEDDTLIMRSSNRKTSFELPIELLDRISKIAKQEEISISKWIELKLSSILK
ncbi:MULTISPECIES: hypothetical protein [Peribacillus]|uniref:hypothetical protein n=1 Tax=Peribacillus TaxID=2675229 RepID=UPI003334F9F6